MQLLGIFKMCVSDCRIPWVVQLICDSIYKAILKKKNTQSFSRVIQFNVYLSWWTSCLVFNFLMASLPWFLFLKLLFYQSSYVIAAWAITNKANSILRELKLNQFLSLWLSRRTLLHYWYFRVHLLTSHCQNDSSSKEFTAQYYWIIPNKGQCWAKFLTVSFICPLY